MTPGTDDLSLLVMHITVCIQDVLSLGNRAIFIYICIYTSIVDHKTIWKESL